MIERFNKIIQYTFEEINKSPELFIEFLQIYSILYLQGKDPGTCEKCHRGYFEKMKQNGLKKAEKMNTERTCKPNWKGNLFSSKAQRHFNSQSISDEEAVKALNSGSLIASQFDVLPEGFEKTPVLETPVGAVEQKEAKSTKQTKKSK